MFSQEEEPFGSHHKDLQNDAMQEQQGELKNGLLGESASKRIKLEDDGQVDHEDPMEILYLASEVSGIKSHQNPFLLSPVLEVLFSKLDFGSLKAARQVCHLWKNEVLPIFKEKTKAVLRLEEICHCCCNHRTENVVQCSEFLKTMEEAERKDLPFRSLKVEYIDMRRQRLMSKIFWKYGSLLSCLSIVFCTEYYDNEDDHYNLDWFFRAQDLKLILLYWCPNLKTLELKNLPFNIVEKSENIFSVEERTNRKNYVPGGPLSNIKVLKFEDSRSFFPLGEMFVFHLFKVSPNLTTIEINLEDDDAFDQFILALAAARKAGLLKNLHSLKFGSGFGCIFYGAQLVYLLEMDLGGLKNLEILGMGQDFSVDGLLLLFHRCGHSLETFRLNVSPFANRDEFSQQILQYLPSKMNKMKHLEIKCDKIRISEDCVFTTRFPNIQTCVLDTECDCGFGISGGHWTNLTLKLKGCPNFHREELQTIQLEYKTHCIRSYYRLMKWFPSIHSLCANKGEDRFGLTDLFRTMSESELNELYVEVSCQKNYNSGIYCCRNDSIENEETQLRKSLENCQRNQTFFPLENDLADSFPFPDLVKLKIVSNGCRNIHINTLRLLGIMNLLENAPKLEDFKIEYSYKTISKTVTVFDFNRESSFESEQ